MCIWTVTGIIDISLYNTKTANVISIQHLSIKKTRSILTERHVQFRQKDTFNIDRNTRSI